jgi:hypothetical protein
MESADHLFVHCRFTLRLWNKAKEWLGLLALRTNNWADLFFPEWWNISTSGHGRKGLATLYMLIIWEIWNERNDRVFKNKQAPLQIIFDRVKKEARLWVLAGAKHLDHLMPGE